uniref:Sphingosine kinase 1 n=1 Tax=Hucho hucho TaxID=62062 RepID=A0A4W5K4L6_9TELE
SRTLFSLSFLPPSPCRSLSWRFSLSPIEHQNHARDLVRETDLSQWDALVILSGDGLLFEVLNGLLEREDWEEAIQTPLGILPGGSGNALAASLAEYEFKSLVTRLDLVSVHLASSQRIFSFLSLAWGFVADVDIESEKYRLVGPMRFLVGTLMRLASLRVYQGRLAYLPAPPSTPQNSSLFNQKGPPDSLLADLEQPVPEHWTVVNEEDFVLVLAMFQSHLAEDLFAAPGATADDGFIHLLYVRAGISRLALLTLFMTMEKGGHLAIGCPHLVYERVKAFRLEP